MNQEQLELEILVEEFNKEYSEKFKEVSSDFGIPLLKYDFGDVVTEAGHDGGCFILEKANNVTHKIGPFADEVVKRYELSRNTLVKIVGSSKEFTNFFKQLLVDVENLNLTEFTFDPPNGGNILRLMEGGKSAELRVYGLRY